VLPFTDKQEVVELCLKYNAKVLNVPPVSNWINGNLSFRQIRKVKIEELMERDPIQLDEENIREQIHNKTVLITGAAGSIGSEIARQVASFHPGHLILLDQAESPLYEMELELKDHFPKLSFEVVMGDVRNKERMENVFRTFRPELIYHAAAYKHVPMMENNPSESILTNVLGTQICADLAVHYNSKKFVMVSTDKAVNPTNVMGASKRIAEMYVQSLNAVSGSVTITHPEITRFFMTIPEACRLVLEAGCMGQGGEIYIFDMGESVKIKDLAVKMIQLSGLELNKDIKIVYTGLRPGEKLYEELLNNSENTLPTHHEKIMIARVTEYPYDKVKQQLKQLIELFDKQDNVAIVKQMKQMVPEYISNNSVFESLDQK